MGTLRRYADGMRGFLIAAAVFAVLGILAVLLEVQSPSFVQWSGIEVHGYTQNGITYYSYRGVPYTVDNPKAPATDPRKVPTTVWLHRGDPTDSGSAWIDSPSTRWTDLGFTAGWFFAALVLLTVGVVRQRRRGRRRVGRMGEFGYGLSDEVVQRIRAERQGRTPAGS